MQQFIGRYYVPYFNYHYKRTGTLWEGRYKATMVDASNYLFTCMRYIEMNPVRAGIVKSPAEYKWSSYHKNALGIEDSLVVPHFEYNSLGKTDLDKQKAYIDLFNSLLSSKDINLIREQTNKGWVIGSEDFKKNIYLNINRQMEPKLKGGDRRSLNFKNK